MGILNLTEDSFYAKSRIDAAEIIRRAEKMIREGAWILDLGAQSTRPGAELLGAETEKVRLMEGLKLVRKEFPDAFISVDTFYGEVAEESINSGADMINDISAWNMDPKMLEVVTRLKVPYVLMHMLGTPASMHKSPHYVNPISDLIKFFSEKIEVLRAHGLGDIMIDPGFGFGKNFEQNQEIFRGLENFQVFNLPMVVGISRKKMIQRLTGSDVEGALNGTTAAHVLALQRGADILRVHDVKEAVQAVEVFLSLG